MVIFILVKVHQFKQGKDTSELIQQGILTFTQNSINLEKDDLHQQMKKSTMKDYNSLQNK